MWGGGVVPKAQAQEGAGPCHLDERESCLVGHRNRQRRPVGFSHQFTEVLNMRARRGGVRRRLKKRETFKNSDPTKVATGEKRQVGKWCVSRTHRFGKRCSQAGKRVVVPPFELKAFDHFCKARGLGRLCQSLVLLLLELGKQKEPRDDEASHSQCYLRS